MYTSPDQAYSNLVALDLQGYFMIAKLYQVHFVNCSSTRHLLSMSTQPIQISRSSSIPPTARETALDWYVGGLPRIEELLRQRKFVDALAELSKWQGRADSNQLPEPDRKWMK